MFKKKPSVYDQGDDSLYSCCDLNIRFIDMLSACIFYSSYSSRQPEVLPVLANFFTYLEVTLPVSSQPSLGSQQV